ncbi:MAG TPA: hypothetical protein P5279_11325 [Anaerohalosphaeraceae bacterium]|jgi:hypothetical protein|nr:hypothetical protein [Anaerohalosphaeraceae bacterium]HRT51078.1 hypothetical protein [Anaerohalosphaeraceae bacterium]HRT87093.1 hypothetical protein [Anaerohalosphaeraceae bacterium]
MHHGMARWVFALAVCVSGAGAPAFENPGVYSRTVRGRLYEWIPTQDVTFDIRPDGRVRMVLPESKPSFDGTNACRSFIYDHAHRRLKAAEEGALRGEGLMLADGNYGFAIQWIKAGSYEEVFENPWNLTCNPDTYRSNSGQLDYVNISIVPLRAQKQADGDVREVMLPYDLQRVSWLPHYQVLPYDLRLPPDKGFGVTRLLWDIPLEQIYRKVTHIQYCYHELDTVPANRKWKNKQALDHSGRLASNEWLIADHPMDRDFITAAEMDENFGTRGVKDHSERSQQVLEGIYRRMEKELGVTSPNQTRLYDDYFGALAGYDNSVTFLWDFNEKRLIEGLASQEMARMRYFDGKWIPCAYFSEGAYKYRNWLQGGYLDSYPVCPEGIRIYNEIYNYERKFVAAPDRRVLKFGWSNAEGVNSNMYRAGTKSRLHWPQGDIIRQVEVAWPFHMMLNEALWALLLGNDYVLWHSNVRLVSDPYAFGDSWAAGAGKTQWQPVGGEITDYDPDKPGHVKRVRSPKGQFPPNPHMGESGAFAGAWLVGQITAVSDRTSRTLEYATYSYRVNGGAVESGYADSNKPEKGSLGSAALSRYGTANAGQANIVRIYAARKPLCIYGEGRDGAAVIFQNVYCGLTDRTDVMVETRSGPKRFSVVGNDLHVFYVD